MTFQYRMNYTDPGTPYPSDAGFEELPNADKYYLTLSVIPQYHEQKWCLWYTGGNENWEAYPGILRISKHEWVVYPPYDLGSKPIEGVPIYPTFMAAAVALRMELWD